MFRIVGDFRISLNGDGGKGVMMRRHQFQSGDLEGF